MFMWEMSSRGLYCKVGLENIMRKMKTVLHNHPRIAAPGWGSPLSICCTVVRALDNCFVQGSINLTKCYLVFFYCYANGKHPIVMIAPHNK